MSEFEFNQKDLEQAQLTAAKEATNKFFRDVEKEGKSLISQVEEECVQDATTQFAQDENGLVLVEIPNGADKGVALSIERKNGVKIRAAMAAIKKQKGHEYIKSELKQDEHQTCKDTAEKARDLLEAQVETAKKSELYELEHPPKK